MNVEIPVEGGRKLMGDLMLPKGAKGLVIFAHGSGSSRFSPRNQAVARALKQGGFGTLLFDLLTTAEEAVDDVTRELRFDIPFLAQRLVQATLWLKQDLPSRLQNCPPPQNRPFESLCDNPSSPALPGRPPSALCGSASRSSQNGSKSSIFQGREVLQPTLPIGYFGASTGAAAALVAAAALPRDIGAVVSRGGRPDLAKEALPNVAAPTLLLVGSYDSSVIALNEEALRQLKCRKKLQIVEGASHLFEEPGKLEIVAQHALEWFAAYL